VLCTQALGLAVSGSYAYVAAYVSDSLVVVDISNPASPVLRGSVVSSSFLDGVRVALSLSIMLAPAARRPQDIAGLPTNNGSRIRSAIIETSKGSMYFELFPEEAPWHVANFKYLADKRFYNGLAFHLFQPGYLIQGGDPKGNGFGTPGYSLPPEFSSRNHRFGTLGMARVPDGYNAKHQLLNPQRRSSGCQFHILLSEAPHMDGRYTIFGKLVGGRDTLERLSKGDSIKTVKVFIREGGR
jgi:cyclophilin family peptidyl-prolyl cis-trans isomerase